MGPPPPSSSGRHLTTGGQKNRRGGGSFTGNHSVGRKNTTRTELLCSTSSQWGSSSNWDVVRRVHLTISQCHKGIFAGWLKGCFIGGLAGRADEIVDRICDLRGTECDF